MCVESADVENTREVNEESAHANNNDSGFIILGGPLWLVFSEFSLAVK